ncbi:RAD55 family ATPase [Symbioplanes lichenis]|uniref:RAD55 family ATPase n=1 Tax=Symbioplanes lichenis TaxID=1629072 RepID=UPI00273835E5|nr:ATPase domain-containing protein [Actinoplanes lichenis]
MKHLGTGLADLDLILGGGLLPGSVVVVSGPPGTGKTILAQQICFAVATAERKAVYYTTLSEPHAKLVNNLRQFSFFDPEALGNRVEYVHLGDLLRDTQAPLDPLIDEVVRKALDDEPAIVVIDSTKMLRDFVSDHMLRAALYDLTSRVAHSGAVLLLLGEYTEEEVHTGVESALADGIIMLSLEIREPVDRRGLRVRKMRGAAPLGGTHTVHITGNGFSVYPRLEAFLPTDMPARGKRITSGIRNLDALMDGGIPDGDGTVVLGPSGVGKTIGCLGFVAEGLARGERCLYVTFQDTIGELEEMAARFGWDFHAARERDQLIVAHVPVGALDLDLDVLSAMIRRHLTDGSIRRVVIDSLAEMAHAAREAQRFPAYLRSMLGIIRAAGASLWVTSEIRLLGPVEDPLAGLMYLFHNVIQVRFVEHCAEIGRVLNIVKMRNSKHTLGMYACHVDDNGGLLVGEQLERVTGMLGWSVLRDCPPLPVADTQA